MMQYDTVPIRFDGGPLDGDVNSIDYMQHELEEMLAASSGWDYTPAVIDGRRDDVIERYKLTRQGGEWVFAHTGTFERPVLERNITATFVGGPRDGQTTRFLGSIRSRLDLATSHYPGYVLRHDGGDDPLAGWTMQHVEAPQ